MMKKATKIKELRNFGFVLGILFPILVGFIIPALSNHEFARWTILVSTPLLLMALINPKGLKKPYQVWISIGNMLGWVNSRIILGLVFILVLQPIAYVMRIFGYDPLRMDRNKQKNSATYRENIKDRRIDLTRIF